jgi:hypothetical protein
MATANTDINSLIYSVSNPNNNGGDSNGAASIYSQLNGLGLPEGTLNGIASASQGLSLPPTPAPTQEHLTDKSAMVTSEAPALGAMTGVSVHGIVPTLQYVL